VRSRLDDVDEQMHERRGDDDGHRHGERDGDAVLEALIESEQRPLFSSALEHGFDRTTRGASAN